MITPTDVPGETTKRVVAKLGPGDHFGETAFLEDRKVRNASVVCVTDACELKAMANEVFKECLEASPQLTQAVEQAAKMRTSQRIRASIEAAVDAGNAITMQAQGGCMCVWVRAMRMEPLGKETNGWMEEDGKSPE